MTRATHRCARERTQNAEVAAPLIVTLDLDERSSAFFESRRRRWFPAERNVVAAHVTLFHALPGNREAEVAAELAALAERPAFPVSVSGVRLLGKGVAYDLRAPAAVALRDRMAERFATDLTRQDAQRLKAHVTVANKLTPERARELFAQLEADFVPFEAQAAGVSLFRYVGGPWETVRTYPFSPGPDPA
jgi:2'-5' RNA ligase